MTIDMKLNAVQQAAENSRVALRQKRLSAGGVLADSPKPVIVGVPDGGTVPVTLLKSTAAQTGTTTAARQPDLPVTLRVSGWEFPNDRDMVVIEGYPFKDGVDDPDKPEEWAWEVLHTESAPPVANRPSEWNVTIPAGKLTDLPATGSVSPTHWKIQSSGALDGNPQYSLIADYYVDILLPFTTRAMYDSPLQLVSTFRYPPVPKLIALIWEPSQPPGWNSHSRLLTRSGTARRRIRPLFI